MNSYRNAEIEYRERCKARIQRQLEISEKSSYLSLCVVLILCCVVVIPLPASTDILLLFFFSLVAYSFEKIQSTDD